VGDFKVEAVPGGLTMRGAVELLRAQGKAASEDSLWRWLRRNNVTVGRFGKSLLIPPDALTGYKHGR
jgi:hypothetical protein